MADYSSYLKANDYGSDLLQILFTVIPLKSPPPEETDFASLKLDVKGGPLVTVECSAMFKHTLVGSVPSASHDLKVRMRVNAYR